MSTGSSHPGTPRRRIAIKEEDLEELRADTAALLALKDVDMPTYADPEQVSRRAVDEVIGFQGYPTTLILDRQGVIRGVWDGVASAHQLETLIDRLDEEK